MKNLIFLILIIGITKAPVFSCSCVAVSYCDNLDKYTDDNDLIFMGSFIQREDIDGVFYAVEYRVEEVFSGEIITPASPLYEGESRINTDSTLWVISANSGICMPFLEEQKAVIAISYKEGEFSNVVEFGYSPSTCEYNYFPVSQDETVTGFFESIDGEEELTIEEFRELTVDGCGNRLTSTIDDPINEQFSTYPQPTKDLLNISTAGDINDWQISLLDVDGRLIQTCQLEVIDLSNLDSGVYFVQFVKERQRYVKRIIKI